MTNKVELECALKRARLSKRGFAEKLGISIQALYNKINNTAEFKASEILKACEILSLANSEKEIIFFAHDVD